MKHRPLTGTITALVTPFSRGHVDTVGLKKLVKAQLRGGVNGLVPMGTTGESPTVSHEEHMDVVSTVIETVEGNVPVIAGAGSNSTREAEALTARAPEAGADVMLAVAPYYNKPSPAGLFLPL